MSSVYLEITGVWGIQPRQLGEGLVIHGSSGLRLQGDRLSVGLCRCQDCIGFGGLFGCSTQQLGNPGISCLDSLPFLIVPGNISNYFSVSGRVGWVSKAMKRAMVAKLIR